MYSPRRGVEDFEAGSLWNITTRPPLSPVANSSPSWLNSTHEMMSASVTSSSRAPFICEKHQDVSPLPAMSNHVATTTTGKFLHTTKTKTTAAAASLLLLLPTMTISAASKISRVAIKLLFCFCFFSSTTATGDSGDNVDDDAAGAGKDSLRS